MGKEKDKVLSMPASMLGRFQCDVPSAAPAVYDSRFDPTVTDLAYDGKVKRRARAVKRGAILSWVGLESRGQFIALDDKTAELNEKDHKMLLKKLEELGVELTDEESKAPLHQLAKTYNYFDPRLAHVRRKASRIVEQVPILGSQKKVSNVLDDKEKVEKAELRKWLKDNKVAVTNFDNLDTLRKKKADAVAAKDPE
jgi:hypothetical protein